MELVEDFEKGKLKLSTKIKAKDLFKLLMKSAVETGMPYLFFRDTADKGNPNTHAGRAFSSQLCTEIIQNTSPSKFIEETLEDNRVSITHKP